MRLLAWTSLLGLLCVGGCDKHLTATAPVAPPEAGSAPSSPSDAPKPSPDPSVTPAKPSAEDPRSGAVPKLPKSPIKPPDKIPPAGGEGWHATAMKPLVLAKKMDAAFYHLQGGDADIHVHFLLPIGEGFCTCSAKFPSDTAFSVKYPIIEGDPPHPQVVEVRGNDRYFVHFHPGQGEKTQAYSQRLRFAPGGSLNPKDVLENWPGQMPSLSMSHFVTGKDVYTPLVSALASPGSGYTLTTEERTLNRRGVAMKDYRIMAMRKATPANHNRAVQIELVVDARKFVPVTMRTNVKPAKGKASVIEWAGDWKGGKFDPKDFELPG